MVKVEPSYYFQTVQHEEVETKPMNPNDLLLSMFNTLPLQEGTSSVDSQGVNHEDFAQSLLRSILSQPLNSPQTGTEEETESNSLRQPVSLSTLNPALASALSGMMNQKPVNNDINLASNSNARPMKSFCNENYPLSRRVSGPVKVEGPVVPLHIQRHAEGGWLDLPSSHTVSYNGRQEEVPDEIHCHLCNYPMKMCYRKSKYKQEIREYPAYRCLRKGCQTFRAIRKVLDEESIPQEIRKRPQEQNSVLKNLLGTSHVTESQPPSKKGKKGNGTLVYIPFTLNPEQVQKLQKAARRIVAEGRLLEEGEVLQCPVIVTTSLTSEELQKKLKTEAGIQEIKKELEIEATSLGQAILC